MMNMILAIVFDIYAGVKAETGNSDTLLRQVQREWAKSVRKVQKATLHAGDDVGDVANVAQGVFGFLIKATDKILTVSGTVLSKTVHGVGYVGDKGLYLVPGGRRISSATGKLVGGIEGGIQKTHDVAGNVFKKMDTKVDNFVTKAKKLDDDLSEDNELNELEGPENNNDDGNFERRQATQVRRKRRASKEDSAAASFSSSDEGEENTSSKMAAKNKRSPSKDSVPPLGWFDWILSFICRDPKRIRHWTLRNMLFAMESYNYHPKNYVTEQSVMKAFPGIDPFFADHIVEEADRHIRNQKMIAPLNLEDCLRLASRTDSNMREQKAGYVFTTLDAADRSQTNREKTKLQKSQKETMRRINAKISK